jgi:hypothetical protein
MFDCKYLICMFELKMKWKNCWYIVIISQLIIRSCLLTVIEFAALSNLSLSSLQDSAGHVKMHEPDNPNKQNPIKLTMTPNVSSSPAIWPAWTTPDLRGWVGCTTRLRRCGQPSWLLVRQHRWTTQQEAATNVTASGGAASVMWVATRPPPQPQSPPHLWAPMSWINFSPFTPHFHCKL